LCFLISKILIYYFYYNILKKKKKKKKKGKKKRNGNLDVVIVYVHLARLKTTFV
jgi:hypothetical protein